VVGGGFAEGYAQDVLLQFGTAALLLILILMVERAISSRLRSELDDRDVVRRAEAVLDMDDMWRDLGQKLSGKAGKRRSLADVEDWMWGAGWEKYRVLEGHNLWRCGTRMLALPIPRDGLLPAPHVRLILRRLGLNEEEVTKSGSDTAGDVVCEYALPSASLCGQYVGDDRWE
jgi:hypothetical protein